MYNYNYYISGISLDFNYYMMEICQDFVCSTMRMFVNWVITELDTIFGVFLFCLE